MLLDIGRLVAGLVVLVGGGELLIRGASGLARRLGMSPLLVGLTVVSLATSAPELAVSLDAALTGETDVALGNVVGSNIANVLLVLGVAAVVRPLIVNLQLVKFDVPVMIAMSVLLLWMAQDGSISITDGIVLLAAAAIYAVVAVIIAKRDASRELEHQAEEIIATLKPETPLLQRVWMLPILIVVGVALLVGGANLLVTGASNLAVAAGVSPLLVGLTIVAVGTSLPELAASVIAVLRGQRDLAVGNVVGSSIANIGIVLGLPALVAGGLPVPTAALEVDLPFLVATSIALTPVLISGFVVARWEGALFVALYLAYVAFVVVSEVAPQILGASGRSALGLIVALVLIVVTAVLIFEVTTIRSKRAQKASPGR